AARVIVHAEEIERAVVAIELIAPIEVRPVELEHVLRVAAPEQWIEEPAVEITIHPRGRVGVGWGIAGGIARRQVEGDPDARVRARRADGFRGGAVREKKVMARTDRGLEVADARRVHADVMTCERD